MYFFILKSLFPHPRNHPLVLYYLFFSTKPHPHSLYSGEAAPGCSAHEDGCDGSTGTEQ